MMLEVYSVYDKAVKAFLPPVFVRSRGEILRSFTSSVNEQSHNFNKFGADYTLFYIGTFDDNSGLFGPTDPLRIVSALEVVVDDPFTPETRVDGNGRATA